MAEPGPVAARPWSQRLLEAGPWPPFATAALAAAVLVALWLGLEAASGRLALLSDEGFRQDLRVGVVLCLLLAYLPAVRVHAERGARATAAALEPALRPGADRDRLAAVGRFDPAALRRAGWTGVAVLLVAGLLVEWSPSRAMSVSAMSPEALVHRGLGVLIGWFVGRTAWTLGVESRRLSRIGRDDLALDLLDLAPAGPLLRQGLRQALLTIGGFSLLSILFFDLGAAPNLIWLLLVASVLLLGMAVAALLLPVRGVRDAIVREKARELGRCNEAIRAARERPEGASDLAGWVAYRTLVDGVREWPVDAPALARFALYLAIPLGSWLGGALVERWLDAALS